MIGLSISLHDFGDYGSVGFQRPVALAGGVPVALSRLDGSFLDDALDACDGILLGGGRDIEPRLFGQEPTEHLAATEPHRDAFELELVRRALERKLPILGACRGIQILNVALGGTLVQDVSVKAEWAEHPSDRGWRAWKEVERASLAGEVDSFHHQALDRVAPGLTVVARAPDGVVEAVEMDGDAYVLAVQWELQEEWRVDGRFLATFAQFVAAAAERR